MGCAIMGKDIAYSTSTTSLCACYRRRRRPIDISSISCCVGVYLLNHELEPISFESRVEKKMVVVRGTTISRRVALTLMWNTHTRQFTVISFVV